MVSEFVIWALMLMSPKDVPSATTIINLPFASSYISAAVTTYTNCRFPRTNQACPSATNSSGAALARPPSRTRVRMRANDVHSKLPCLMPLCMGYRKELL